MDVSVCQALGALTAQPIVTKPNPNANAWSRRYILQGRKVSHHRSEAILRPKSRSSVLRAVSVPV